MSCSFTALGTKSEVSAQVTKSCDGNTSPEMPQVKAFLLDLLGSVEGDDKRVVIEAEGSHYYGQVFHKIQFKTVVVPVPSAEPPEA